MRKQGSGWRNESHRHRLAGMGIKTSSMKIKASGLDFTLETMTAVKSIINKFYDSSEYVVGFAIQDVSIIRRYELSHCGIVEKFDESPHIYHDTDLNIDDIYNMMEKTGFSGIWIRKYGKTHLQPEKQWAYWDMSASGQFYRFDELKPHIKRKVLRYDTIEEIRRANPLYSEEGTEIY